MFVRVVISVVRVRSLVARLLCTVISAFFKIIYSDERIRFIAFRVKKILIFREGASLARIIGVLVPAGD